MPQSNTILLIKMPYPTDFIVIIQYLISFTKLLFLSKRYLLSTPNDRHKIFSL
nr:MAG TPA: hypothetical protein [Caudoviricetes sp.]